MDGFDVKILAALQTDGRLTNYDLACAVGLFASQCSRRRTALEESGVIASYHAHLSPKTLGLDIVVLVQVTLATHSPDNSKRFKELIDGLEAVQEAYAVTGAADYHIKLVVPDLAALSRILNEVFLRHESVQHVHSSIVLHGLKETSALPLAHLVEETEHSGKAARRKQ